MKINIIKHIFYLVYIIYIIQFFIYIIINNQYIKNYITIYYMVNKYSLEEIRNNLIKLKKRLEKEN